MLRQASPPTPTSLFVSPFSAEGYGTQRRMYTTPGNQAYPAANRAHYYPIVVPMACTMYRFFWANGTTVGTNNIQVGVYNDNDSGTDGPGTSVLLGTSTLSAGASVCQFDDITDTPLYPGKYWLAIWCNGTTATTRAMSQPVNLMRPNGGYIESALAGGLPATATPAAQTNNCFLPIFGFTTIATP